MDVKRQVEIIEGQLAHLDTLTEKMQYLTEFFQPDPDFTKEATDIVRSNICKTLKPRR